MDFCVIWLQADRCLKFINLTVWMRKCISLMLRHGWRPKSTQKHTRNAQVVPILYSTNCTFSRYRRAHSDFSGHWS